ncbi:MAG: hypothetical protein KGJ06_01790 [Pseudomonadota bacterium]|nr:hypothetical protein [Pseudomonadota bacterium]
MIAITAAILSELLCFLFWLQAGAEGQDQTLFIQLSWALAVLHTVILVELTRLWAFDRRAG